MGAGSPDIAVLGRGLMGTACARHLADMGARVTLIGPDEPVDPARHGAPFASHHDAARITRVLSSDADWSRLAARSIARYAALEAAGGAAFYDPCGCLVATRSDATARAMQAAAAALGETVTLHRGDTLTAAHPMFRFGAEVRAGLDPAGGTINPRLMRRAMEADAMARGAEVLRGVGTSLDHGGLSLDDGTRLTPGHVVVATGGYAGLDGLLSPAPDLRVYARTVFLAEVTEAEATALRDMPGLLFMGEAGAHDIYVLPPVRYPDGKLRVKIGGEDDSPPLRDAAAARDWFRAGGDRATADALRAQLAQVMPDLPLHRGSHKPCIVTYTAHDHPYIDRVADGVTVLTGGCGAAAKSADEIGRLGAVMALQGSLAGEGYDSDFRMVRA